MEKLSYQYLKEQSYEGYLLPEAPEKVLQFGEGNFLRAFADAFIDQMNEKTDFNSKVVVCQPGNKDPNGADRINGQEGLYTLILQGSQQGEQVQKKRVISCISRCLNLYRDYKDWMECAENPQLRFIICNTTEAGITYDPTCEFSQLPPSSYPAKLTQFLYRRFQIFGNAKGRGFIILACELIDDNGKELEKCVLQYAKQWGLEEKFCEWLRKENVFCSTLVDRIVSGYPKDAAPSICQKLGYQDDLLDIGEPFALWVIEGPKWIEKELPFAQAGLPVVICDNYKPYKQRKVRILNGAHTTMVLGAFLAGKNIVRESMEDVVIRKFTEQAIYDEIIPTLTLPEEELKEFAKTVISRFENPFVDHELLSISLNSTSKWKARVLPSLQGYVKKYNRLPGCLVASFAFYLAFYKGNKLTEKGLLAIRGAEEYVVQDDRKVLEFFAEHSRDSDEKLVSAVCADEKMWGEDLRQISGFEQAVVACLKEIREKGVYECMKRCLK